MLYYSTNLFSFFFSFSFWGEGGGWVGGGGSGKMLNFDPIFRNRNSIQLSKISLSLLCWKGHVFVCLYVCTSVLHLMN